MNGKTHERHINRLLYESNFPYKRERRENTKVQQNEQTSRNVGGIYNLRKLAPSDNLMLPTLRPSQETENGVWLSQLNVVNQNAKRKPRARPRSIPANRTSATACRLNRPEATALALISMAARRKYFIN